MTEKWQTSQVYIIRILQHFAMKLRNITNFVMLFQAVMKFLSRLVEIKISLKRGKVYCYSINLSWVRHCHTLQPGRRDEMKQKRARKMIERGKN